MMKMLLDTILLARIRDFVINRDSFCNLFFGADNGSGISKVGDTADSLVLFRSHHNEAASGACLGGVDLSYLLIHSFADSFKNVFGIAAILFILLLENLRNDRET